MSNEKEQDKKKLRGYVTFRKEEEAIYDYMVSKRGYGNFIKDLLEREMIKEIKNGTYKEGKKWKYVKI